MIRDLIFKAVEDFHTKGASDTKKIVKEDDVLATDSPSATKEDSDQYLGKTDSGDLLYIKKTDGAGETDKGNLQIVTADSEEPLFDKDTLSKEYGKEQENKTKRRNKKNKKNKEGKNNEKR
jgi:hypothetical protein